MHTKDTLIVGNSYTIKPGSRAFFVDGEAQRPIIDPSNVLVHSVSDAKFPSWARVSLGTELLLVHPDRLEDLPVEQSAEVKVGDTVHLKAGGSFARTGEYSGKRLYPDDDLVVTRVTTHKLLVRKSEMGSFWIDKEKFAQPDEQAKIESDTSPAEGDIAIDDPRIAWIWKKAARLADDLDFCEEYDNITQRLGVPPRARERSVLVRFADLDGVSSEAAWVTVLAGTDDEAIEKAKALMSHEGNTYTVEVD